MNERIEPGRIHHPDSCGPCADCREALGDYARAEQEALMRAFWRTVNVVPVRR